MHWIWWMLWIIFLFWVFLTPWDIPGQRKRKDSPLNILKKRYAAGEINTQEYEERKKVIDKI
jgi:putative membrane protein